MGDSRRSSVFSRQVRSLALGRWSLAKSSLFWLFASCRLAAVAQQKTLVLKGGKLLTVSHGTIENGVLVMSGGQDHRRRRGRFGHDSERRAGHRRDRDDGVSRD